MNGIERETFSGMEVEDKLNVLYDYHVSMHNLVFRMFAEKCPAQAAACNKRMDDLEARGLGRDEHLKNIDARKWWNTAASAVGGVIGGAVAILAKTFFVEK